MLSFGTVSLCEIADFSIPVFKRNSDPLSELSTRVQVFYSDAIGGYGPTVRYFFVVENEQEIINRAIIVDVQKA